MRMHMKYADYLKSKDFSLVWTQETGNSHAHDSMFLPNGTWPRLLSLGLDFETDFIWVTKITFFFLNWAKTLFFKIWTSFDVYFQGMCQELKTSQQSFRNWVGDSERANNFHIIIPFVLFVSILHLRAAFSQFPFELCAAS